VTNPALLTLFLCPGQLGHPGHSSPNEQIQKVSDCSHHGEQEKAAGTVKAECKHIHALAFR
jgi:hypothetical protein